MTPKNFSTIILLSNCASQSQRENILGDLGRVVPVDIVGACGQPDAGSYDASSGILYDFSRLATYHIF